MNQLPVSLQQTIITLSGHGWSQRRIAQELALDRGTVAKYLRAESKPATNLTLGSGEQDPPKPATNPTLGSEAVAESKPASDLTLGSKPGPASRSAPFAEQCKAPTKRISRVASKKNATGCLKRDVTGCWRERGRGEGAFASSPLGEDPIGIRGERGAGGAGAIATASPAS